MTDWLLDTLLWTAVLIGFVLLVRRPVARWFGPQIAYALWALPMLRLALPPIHLPAWLAPDQPATTADQTNQFLILAPAAQDATPEAVADPLAGSGSTVPDAATSWTPQSLTELLPLLDLVLVAWLAGAVIFLWMRFSAYFELRDELLRDAREVGRTGRIRLIETARTKAPLAFGVLDPVIALPHGFMALTDRKARDLALAHEVAHHEGRDLLINIAVQPLFALHWWNPLGRYGWHALRRDQEAACDARVIASEPAETRAAYADVIAGFAAGPDATPNAALTAPMACPVLGDKSIIQRLRSLTMSDTSPRRRIAGRTMLGAAVLALPLTASITYAEVTAPDAPAAPAAPKVAVAPPAPPVAPLPPAALLAQEIVKIDPDAEVEVETSEDGRAVVIRKEIDTDGDGTKEKRIEKIRIINKGEKMSDEELEKMMKELRAGLAEADAVIKDVPKIVKEAMIDIDMDHDGKRTVVKMECRGDSKDVATVEEGEGKVKKIYLCQSQIMANALEGLKEARSAIASNSEIEENMRTEMLKALDEQIEVWKKDKG